MEDPNYKHGFKFDHVWNTVRHFEKFKDDVNPQINVSRKHDVNYLSSESENPTPDSQSVESPGLSPFHININDDIGGSSSQRPCGVKKSKALKKTDDIVKSALDKLQEETHKLTEILERSTSERLALKKQSLAEKVRKREAKERFMEDQILMQDLSTINDPNARAFIEARKAEIQQKRGQFQQPPPFASNSFGDYFNNLSGSGTNFPDY